MAKTLKKQSTFEKQFCIEHFGTTDMKLISKIQNDLYMQKITQRVGYFMRTCRLDDVSKYKGVYAIRNFSKIVGREKAVLKMSKHKFDLTPTEKMIYEIDKCILIEQFIRKGYTKVASIDIVNKIYTAKDMWSIKSLNVEDYIIECDNILIQPEKYRYQRLVQKSEQSVQEMQ